MKIKTITINIEYEKPTKANRKPKTAKTTTVLGRPRKLDDNKIAQLAQLIERGTNWEKATEIAKDTWAIDMTIGALKNYPQLKSARRKHKRQWGPIDAPTSLAEAQP